MSAPTVIREGEIVFNNGDYCGRVVRNQFFSGAQPEFVIHYKRDSHGPLTAESAVEPVDSAFERVGWYWNEPAQRWDMNASAEALKEFRTRGILK